MMRITAGNTIEDGGVRLTLTWSANSPNIPILHTQDGPDGWAAIEMTLSADEVKEIEDTLAKLRD